MSSTLFNASPFAAALPAHTVFTSYDEDGDAIMTDAVTGLPIVYGGKRGRSASLDSESSHSSKRSRVSSGEGLSPIKIPRASVGFPVSACPPAPRKSARPVLNPEDDDDDADGGAAAASVLRSLAEQMAETVLNGEPSSPAAAAPAGDGPAPAPAAAEGWCLAVNCADLALRLDMRHPRVVLDFLRFVDSYNELAPYGEEIHLPYMETDAVNIILSHESVANPPPEFADQVAELRARVEGHSCRCPDCDPDSWSHSGPDDDEDNYRYDSDRD
jgi:hypothetical protein